MRFLIVWIDQSHLVSNLVLCYPWISEYYRWRKPFLHLTCHSRSTQISGAWLWRRSRNKMNKLLTSRFAGSLGRRRYQKIPKLFMPFSQWSMWTLDKIELRSNSQKFKPATRWMWNNLLVVHTRTVSWLHLGSKWHMDPPLGLEIHMVNMCCQNGFAKPRTGGLLRYGL